MLEKCYSKQSLLKGIFTLVQLFSVNTCHTTLKMPGSISNIQALRRSNLPFILWKCLDQKYSISFGISAVTQATWLSSVRLVVEATGEESLNHGVQHPSCMNRKQSFGCCLWWEVHFKNRHTNSFSFSLNIASPISHSPYLFWETCASFLVHTGCPPVSWICFQESIR